MTFVAVDVETANEFWASICHLPDRHGEI